MERITRPLFKIDKYIWEEMPRLTTKDKLIAFYQWDIGSIRANERRIKDARDQRA